MLRIDLHRRGKLLAHKNLPKMTRMQRETGCSQGQRGKKQSPWLLMCFRDSTHQGLEGSEVPPVFQGLCLSGALGQTPPLNPKAKCISAPPVPSGAPPHHRYMARSLFLLSFSWCLPCSDHLHPGRKNTTRLKYAKPISSSLPAQQTLQ